MAEQTKVSGEIINASTPEGMQEARKFQVTGVPLVIFLDDEDKELHRCSSKEEIEEVLRNI